MVRHVFVLHFSGILLLNSNVSLVDLTLEETEGLSELVDKDSHLPENASFVLDLADEHFGLGVPLEDLVLSVRDLNAQFCGEVVLAHVEPELFVLRDDLLLDIIEGNLGLDNGQAGIDVENLDHQRSLVVVDFETKFRVSVGGSRSLSGSGLAVLVALVTDNVRVVDSI